MSDAVVPKQVSIVLPVHNADKWLDECLDSVLQQKFDGSLELSAYDDASSDQSGLILKQWADKLMKAGISVVMGSNKSDQPCGVGFAKNQAVQLSSGKYLCFLDADDVMHPLRIQRQYDAAKTTKDTIVGCRFHRTPEGSTPRYTEWANNLDHSQLYTQIYTAFGPTIVMPTWFCHRDVYDKVGGFSESGKVQAFCDVDEKKLAKGIYIYEETEQHPKPRIPIVHFSAAHGPFIICVKLQMTGGDFEKNLSSLNLKEGVDYFHFS